MNEPRFTEKAEADLDQVWAYIARDNPGAADTMIETILENSRIYVQFPNLGQRQEELRSGLRSVVVSPYVVYYRPVQGTIELLRVLHCARDIKNIFRGQR